MKYRPEIDGLRAIAVVSVIVYHAGFTALGGGFLGVDVFFVISGFLITSLIISDLSEGVFTFANFSWYTNLYGHTYPQYLNSHMVREVYNDKASGQCAEIRGILFLGG